MAGAYTHVQRKPLGPNYRLNSCPIAFMQTEIDYILSDNTPTGSQVAIIRIFGVTQEGHSVLALVESFEPYFWSDCPDTYTDKALVEIKKTLNSYHNCRDSVTKIEVHKKENILHYTGQGQQNFLKIFTNVPKSVAGLRSNIEKAAIEKLTGSCQTYESNIPFALRFMIDTGIVGMCWVEIPGMRYQEVEKKSSYAQIELKVDYRDLIVHKPEGQWSKIPPLRVLSFDIECNNDGVTFPTPDKNEVIQIGNICKVPGSEQTISKCVFTLGQCAEIADAQVFSFEREENLLMSWRDYVIDLDPDIITGYNILNFDYNYLFKRAEKLKLKDFGLLGRIKDSMTYVKDTTFQSKAQGLRETKEVGMDGRIQLDMFQHIQREHKLSHYSLNSVSLTFLHEQKEDVHWTILKNLQDTSEDTRRRIAVYCLKDCYLPLRLLEKLMCLYNYTEMARVTGVPFAFLLTRGQQIKVTSQLLRKSGSCDMLIPTLARTEIGDKYEGAFVLEPKRAFYNVPIATLDFASLYPSIMMAHNLCYCTLVPLNLRQRMNKDDYTETPTGEYFVKPHLRKGLLPIILEELIEARKKAREELKHTTDEFMKKVLDGRQLALKISANSVYGFTGAQVGQFPCLQISSSVTAYGRIMIEETKNYVESCYCIQNGFPADSVVVYGDTDSVMINFGVGDLNKTMALGKEAAVHVTQRFIKPIRLEFEKVYFPYLLLNKKRYAGLLWTNPNNYDKIDMKGIESVRRDNCELVRETINTCLHKLLIERNLEGTVEYVKNVVSALLQNRIDLSLLVITKAIGKKSKQEGKNVKNTYTAKQGHVELAKKMQLRDASTAPNVGDRVPYVMIKGTKGQKAYELAEDPIWALKNDLPIDFDYYLEKQLKAPLMRLFEDVIPNSSNLFNGEHTRKRYQPKITSGAMSKFIQITNTCVGCRTSLKNGYICTNCQKNAPALYMEKVLISSNYEKNFQELWTECQRCQGSICQEVLCTNRDCPIYYRREKVRKDIDYIKSELDKLKASW